MPTDNDGNNYGVGTPSRRTAGWTDTADRQSDIPSSRRTPAHMGRGSRTAGWDESTLTPTPTPVPTRNAPPAPPAPPAPSSTSTAQKTTRKTTAETTGHTPQPSPQPSPQPASASARRTRTGASTRNTSSWDDKTVPTDVEGPSAMERYDAAVKEYREINADYQERVKKAEAAVDHAKKEHADAVEAAKKLVKQENDEYARPVDKFAKATLYQNRVVYGKAAVELDPDGVQAVIVDTSGALRGIGSWSTAAIRQSTRLVEEAKESEEERRFIEVRTPRDAMLIPFAVREEQTARFFAARIVTTAQNLASAERNHQERIANFTANVERVTQDTGTIQEAERARDEIKADTHALESARTTVDFARAAVPTLELEEREKRDKKRRTIVIASVIAAVVVVAAVLILVLTHPFSSGAPATTESSAVFADMVRVVYAASVSAGGAGGMV